MNDRLLYSRDGTSLEAAVDLEPRRQTLRDRVLDFMREAGDDGATDDEIAIGLNMGLNTARPRRYELEARHQIVDSGRRRPTTSGRQAIVWIAAPPAPVEPEQIAMVL